MSARRTMDDPLRVSDRPRGPWRARQPLPSLSRHRFGLCATLLAVAWLAACGNTPRPPDWQLDSRDALERATEAYLSGRDRVAQSEFRRAQQALSASAQPEALARAELLRCAARVASLDAVDTPVCPGFETWRDDVSPALRAYADWLQGGTQPATPTAAGSAPGAASARPSNASAADATARLPLLPEAQRAATAAGDDAARRLAAIQAMPDPFSRLLAAAVAVREGVAPPGLVALAVDTASGQGWRRPLLAWLTLQLRRAEAASDTVAASALRRRIQVLSAAANPSGAAAPGAGAASAPRTSTPGR